MVLNIFTNVARLITNKVPTPSLGNCFLMTNQNLTVYSWAVQIIATH